MSATEGESALTEQVQRQRTRALIGGCRGPRGSEPFDQDRTGRGPRGPNESERIRGGSERLQMALTGGPGRVRRACRSGIPRSGPFDLNRTEGIRPGKQTAAGGAAPLRGGEVDGVEASAS
jgi:hypothetical protein